MKSKSKTEQQIPTFRRTHKTKEGFMRWWREQNARKSKKQVAKEKSTQVDSAHSQALMVWADDGGAVD